MGYKLGVHYYNEAKKILIFKWYETDEVFGSTSEEYAQFFAPYVKNMNLAAVIDDEKMDKFSYYKQGKEMIQPILELPVGELDIRIDNVVRIGLNATMSTLRHSSCDHSFSLIGTVCDVLKRNGKIPKEYKDYFEALNANEQYFVNRSELTTEERNKILEIMGSYPNHRDEFIEKAFQEQEPSEDIPYIDLFKKRGNNK